jgi:hypothetical protein
MSQASNLHSEIGALPEVKYEAGGKKQEVRAKTGSCGC